MTEGSPGPRLSARQLSREEAVHCAETEGWRLLSRAERGFFQLRQERLCMPLAIFMDGMSVLLDRPVFIHELADPDRLWAEHKGGRKRADFSVVLTAFVERFGNTAVSVTSTMQ